MKKALFILLLTIATFFMKMPLRAQSVDQRGSTFTVIPPDKPNGVVTWLEYGDGGFSSGILSNRTLGSKAYEPLLVTVPLYDTTKDLRPVTLMNTTAITYSGSNRNIATLHNDVSLIPQGKSIYITRNISEIVPNDPMIFALTYKSPMDKPDGSKKESSKKYYILFFYNDTRSLQPITEEKNLANTGIKNIRKFESESIDFTKMTSIETLEPKVKDYDNCIKFTLDHLPETGERNIFINTDAETNLDIYKSCSIYAIFISEDPTTNAVTKVDDFLIEKIPFALAHDPNYLVQTPYCIRLPKKVKNFDYKLHFQNIGEGDADSVRVIVTLPDGMDNSTLKIKNSTFAGINAKSFLTHKFLQNGKQIEFLFSPRGVLLKGTSVPNAGTNPLTMGEVNFSIDATVNVKDSLESEAAIYFCNAVNKSWNKPVLTNKPVSYYRECCDCSICECKPPPKPCQTFLGLCWWWWVIILVAILLTCWFIIARKKKKAKQGKTETGAYN